MKKLIIILSLTFSLGACSDGTCYTTDELEGFWKQTPDFAGFYIHFTSNELLGPGIQNGEYTLDCDVITVETDSITYNLIIKSLDQSELTINSGGTNITYYK